MLRERIQALWKKIRRFWEVYIGWRISRWWYSWTHWVYLKPVPRDAWPDNIFYVIPDSEMDAEEVYGTHVFNIKTGTETLVCFPLEGPSKIPKEKRISYSEYVQICQELAEKKKKEAEQAARDLGKTETS